MIKCPICLLKFCELTKKEVINTCDGKRVGNICDIEIDPISGRINSVILPRQKKIIGKCKYESVRWENIEKIGEDIVLLRLPREEKNLI